MAFNQNTQLNMPPAPPPPPVRPVVPPSAPVAPVASPVPPVPPVSTPPPVSPPSAQKPKGFPEKILLIIAVAVILLVGFGVLKYFNVLNAPQTTTQPDILLATVGDQKIYKSTVEKLAEQQYSPKGINNTILKNFFNIIVERDILDNEAKKLNISVSTTEINDFLKLHHLSSSQSDTAKYQILKQKITESQIKNVQAYAIGFWVPPYSWPQQPETAATRAAGLKALGEAEQKLKNGDAPLDVVQYIHTNYPSLGPSLNFNGYAYKPNALSPFYQKPQTFIFTKNNIGKFPQLFAKLGSMKAGEVGQEIPTDGGGGNVFKVISVTGSDYSSYDDFLSARKNQLLKIYHNL